MNLKRIRWGVVGLGALGMVTLVVLHWMVFFWVPTESFQGVIQRIFYIHVPSWWVTFLAFGMVALYSAVYLWLGDDRLDMAAVAAAEGGMVFATIGLLTGPLWGRVAWGAWWTWEPRLTLALLLYRATMATRSTMGESLLPVLVFPLVVPVVIYATTATSRLFAGRPVAEVSGNLRMLAAFSLVFLVAGAGLFRFVIEE